MDRVAKAIEADAEDAADYDRAVAADDGVRIPMAVALAIADGARPVRAWRGHRGMMQEQLSAARNVPVEAWSVRNSQSVC